MSAEGSGGGSDASTNGLAMTVPEITGYEILNRIGRGGMGEVYLARQLALGRLVAIKFLLPEHTSDSELDTARFRREAELMAKVSHPNILSIFDFGEAGGYHFLIVEYVEGGDLRRRMVPGKPMAIERVRSILLPAGEALAHLHRQGIVHRDLKPENILLGDGEKPIVSDFGVSILRAGSEAALTKTGRGPGTLGYVAPEQQYGLKVDERADQYSIAALAYELLTGQLPLGLFKPPSHHNPSLGPEVDDVILRALLENPRDRFATIVEFTAGLDRALGAPKKPRPPHFLGRHVREAIGLLVLLVVLTVHFTRPTAIDKEPPPAPAPEDPAAKKLKDLRAYRIWEDRGKPEGKTSEFYEEASKAVDAEINDLAYQIWVASGKPEGKAGEEASPRNRAEAARRLYWKATGEEPPRTTRP